jgi:tetratricopeptide (TPR) repeat protein
VRRFFTFSTGLENTAYEMNKHRPIMRMELVCVLLAGLALAAWHTAPAEAASSTDDLRRTAREALMRGDTQKAVAAFSDVIRERPDDHLSLNDRGVAYKRMGRIEDAIRDYTKALEIKPGFAEALNNRGVALTVKGDYDAAIKDFDEAIEARELKGKALVNRGYAHSKAGRGEKALADYRAALALPDPDPRAFALMGDALAELGAKEQALKMYKLALGVVTDDELLSRVKGEIETLEKTLKPTETEAPASRSCEAKSVENAATGRGATVPAAAASQRVIVRAERGKTGKMVAPQPPAGPESGNLPERLWSRPRKAVEADLEGYGALNEASRKKILSGLSPEATAAYKAALEYVEKNELHKALVRCEDAMQIARRNRNQAGEGWLSLEIGRIHADLGEHPKAVAPYEKALAIFTRIRSADETVLALVDLALSARAAGLKDRAPALVLRAKDQAEAAGHGGLAEDIGELAGLSVGKTERRKAAAREERAAAEAEKRKAKEKGKEKEKATAEAKPIETLPTRTAAPETDKAVPTPAAAPATQPAAPHEKPGSETTVPAAPAEKTAAPAPRAEERGEDGRRDRDPIEKLRRLKAAGDEKGMVPVLEEIAAKYRKEGDCKTALHSLNASLAFREKHSLREGMESALLDRGRAAECMGLFASALEDYGRALAMARAAGDAGRVGATLRSITGGALKTNVDALELARILDNLGAARLKGDEAGIANATAEAARLYRKAGMLTDAVNYYDRAQASLVIEKSDALEEMGEKEKAKEGRANAVETLKKLDHARYLALLEKIGAPAANAGESTAIAGPKR